jgi:hypothetical protein
MLPLYSGLASITVSTVAVASAEASGAMFTMPDRESSESSFFVSLEKPAMHWMRRHNDGFKPHNDGFARWLITGVALVAQFHYAAAACETAAHCSLAGTCASSGECSCFSGFTGPDCSALALGESTAAFSPRNFTTWGGSPIVVNGTYHLYAALNRWGTVDTWPNSSVIVHATAQACPESLAAAHRNPRRQQKDPMRITQ